MAEKACRQEEERTREAAERARRTLREGREFLQRSLEQRRTQGERERQRERGERERRVKAALSLKKNIESSEVSSLYILPFHWYVINYTARAGYRHIAFNVIPLSYLRLSKSHRKNGLNVAT